MAKDKDIRPLVAGNWKMHGLAAAGREELVELARRLERPAACEVAVCPPFTLIALAMETGGAGGFAIGGQDCHPQASGAHTGDISAEMLADLGCRYVIVGHSERRADHGESDDLVRAKVEAAHRAGLIAIVCVGETEAQRDAGQAFEVVEGQLSGSVPEAATAEDTVIAYEPVWAIGTGRTPQPGDVVQMHSAIRRHLERRFATGEAMRILYGGSVKPKNAEGLLKGKNVNGALVGGASLKVDDFDGIIEIYRSDSTPAD